MSVKTADEYKAAARDKSPLKLSFDQVGANPAQAPEDSLDPVVAAARRFLQGFANLDNRTGVQNALNDAGYSGSVSSVILGSSAPNYDTGMGGSAGKQDEKKKQEEWDRLFRLQQQLAERLREIDWEIEKIDQKIHDTKEHMVKLDREKAEIEERIAIYDDHLSGKKSLKVGADGKLENEKIERALQDYERRTGKKVDRKNREELAAGVRDMKTEDRLSLRKAEEERKRCAEELERFDKQKEVLREERKTTGTELEDVETKLKQAQKKAIEAVDSGDRNYALVASKEIREAEKTKQNQDSGGFDELNKLNDLNSNHPDARTNNPVIALNTSVASSIDEKNAEPGLRDNFKTAHGRLQQPETLDPSEITAQNKNPAAKPIG